jgi:shikimate kinase
MGFMGTGKTSTGRVVAEQLSRRFVDMDELIEQRENASIPEIFASRGEPHFRRLERSMVVELAAQQDLVIAPGGGIVLNADNTADLARTGVVIGLRARPQTILKRVGHDTRRPLLQGGDKLQKIQDLLAKRQALYDALPYRLDTDGLSPSEVADQVLDLFRRVTEA